MASNLDEGTLPDRDQLRDSWMALLHRLDLRAVDLIDLPSTPRNHQVCHQQKAWAPDGKHPEHHCFYRVHARPRHDRWTKFALILSIAKRKLLCGARSRPLRD
jgi:hypothetical protein